MQKNINNYIKTTLLAAMLATAARGATEPVDTTYTWDDGTLSGWTASGKANVDNPGDYLRMSFASQGYPYPESCAVWKPVETNTVPVELSFRFLARDSRPSTLKLYLHCRNGRTWRLKLDVKSTGQWTEYTAAVDYSAGWTLGPAATEELFKEDILQVKSIGVYVLRGGFRNAQIYGLDNFNLKGWKPAEDTDSDGIPDYWEETYGLDAGNDTDAEEDADGDGMSNYAEYAAGTDPTRADSVLVVELDITNKVENFEGIIVKWPSAQNRSYSILRGTNLLKGLFPVYTAIPATPPVNVYYDSTATNKGPYYYKIKVE
ncbi:MAG: thrombospondin type 3 repeat-containing protein [Kiritimatiellia bacterium]